MAHHSGPDDKLMDGGMLQALFRKQDASDDIGALMEQLGSTHRHPQGALTEDDEGEIRIGVTVADGKVVLAFGKHVDWIGFGAEQARSIAETLLNRAQECDGIKAVVRRVAD